MHFFESKKKNILPLYNKIVFLTRESFFYKDFKLTDSFSNRIYLIFFHLSFILIVLKNREIEKNNHLLFNFFSDNYDNKILTNKLANYFDKFALFIEDISLNSITKGVFNFVYKE